MSHGLCNCPRNHWHCSLPGGADRVGVRSPSMKSIRELGIGLVGYGGIGRVHALCYRMLPLVYPDLPVSVRVVAVTAASAATAERARRELGAGLITPDLDGLLGLPDVAIVDCCAPTAEHARVAAAALKAGKALFCEKPLAATAEEAAELVELARERGLPGGMNFHFRQVPALQEARRRIEAGLLGELHGFHLRYHRASNLKRDRPVSWRFAGPGGGVLLDLGAHLVDLVLHLLGPVASVGARLRTVIAERPGPGGRPVPIEADDMATLQVELAGGGLGTLEASKVVVGAGDDLRVEAHGSRGSLIFDARDPNGLEVVDLSDARTGRRIPTLSQTQPPASVLPPEAPSGWIQWHLASIAAFLRALGEGSRPRPDLEDGLQVDRVLTAARTSASRRGAPVSI